MRPIDRSLEDTIVLTALGRFKSRPTPTDAPTGSQAVPPAAASGYMDAVMVTATRAQGNANL
jgi:hypothetical protein